MVKASGILQLKRRVGKLGKVMEVSGPENHLKNRLKKRGSRYRSRTSSKSSRLFQKIMDANIKRYLQVHTDLSTGTQGHVMSNVIGEYFKRHL